MCRQHHRLTSLAALTLALATLTARAALADPAPLTQAEVAIATQHDRTSTPPRRTRPADGDRLQPLRRPVL
jgi:hypothetical protein